MLSILTNAERKKTNIGSNDELTCLRSCACDCPTFHTFDAIRSMFGMRGCHQPGGEAPGLCGTDGRCAETGAVYGPRGDVRGVRRRVRISGTSALAPTWQVCAIVVALLTAGSLFACWQWYTVPKVKELGFDAIKYLIIVSAALRHLPCRAFRLMLFLDADAYHRLLIACTAAGSDGNRYRRGRGAPGGDRLFRHDHHRLLFCAGVDGRRFLSVHRDPARRSTRCSSCSPSST